MAEVEHEPAPDQTVARQIASDVRRELENEYGLHDYVIGVSGAVYERGTPRKMGKRVKPGHPMYHDNS